MANVKITGVKAFELKLMKIEREIATKIVDSATLQGINVIKKQAIDNTPKSAKGVSGNVRYESRNHEAGNLKNSVIQKKLKAKRTSDNYFGRIVGYTQGKSGKNGDGWYGNFIEYKTRNRGKKRNKHQSKKNTDNRSVREPSKPISRAYEMKKMAAMQKVIQVMAIKLKQIVK